jgi:hypothetical protein
MMQNNLNGPQNNNGGELSAPRVAPINVQPTTPAESAVAQAPQAPKDSSRSSNNSSAEPAPARSSPVTIVPNERAFLFLFQQIKTVPRSRFASGTTESVKKFKIDFLSETFFLDSHGELSTAAVVV